MRACRRFWKMLEIGRFWPSGGPEALRGPSRGADAASRPLPVTRGAAGAWDCFIASQTSVLLLVSGRSSRIRCTS